MKIDWQIGAVRYSVQAAKVDDALALHRGLNPVTENSDVYPWEPNGGVSADFVPYATVDIELRSGHVAKSVSATSLVWKHVGSSSDIIRFRRTR